MCIKFSVAKKFIMFCIIAGIPIVTILFVFKDMFTTIIALFIFILMALVGFSNYKILLLEDEIILFKLLRKKKRIKLYEVEKIYIEEITVPFRFKGWTRLMHIYTRNDEYIFDIQELDNYKLIEELNTLKDKYKFNLVNENT